MRSSLTSLCNMPSTPCRHISILCTRLYFYSYTYNHLTCSMFYSFDVHYFDALLSSADCKLQQDRTCLCPPGHRQCLGQCLVHRRDATSHFPMNEWERGKCSEAQETSQGYLPVPSSPTSCRNAQHATLPAHPSCASFS